MPDLKSNIQVCRLPIRVPGGKKIRQDLWEALGSRFMLRQVLLPLLTPQSAAFRRLEEILADEDEAELARSKVEWLERFHNRGTR
jgi:hypothetical protein